MQPTPGRIVLVPMDPATNNGADVAPAIITRVWSDTCINIRVLGDGHEEPEWRTSVTYVDSPEQLQEVGHVRAWTWPPRVGA